MTTKAIEDIIQEFEEQKRIISNERYKLLKQVKEREEDAINRQISAKAKYLYSKSIEQPPGSSGLTLNVIDENAGLTSVEIRYKGEICYSSLEGRLNPIQVYRPGEWVEKFEKIYQDRRNDELEAERRRQEEAELRKYKVEMDEFKKCWEREKRSLKNNFGL